jgi:hypothetical protein
MNGRTTFLSAGKTRISLELVDMQVLTLTLEMVSVAIYFRYSQIRFLS